MAAVERRIFSVVHHGFAATATLALQGCRISPFFHNNQTAPITQCTIISDIEFDPDYRCAAELESSLRVRFECK